MKAINYMPIKIIIIFFLCLNLLVGCFKANDVVDYGKNENVAFLWQPKSGPNRSLKLVLSDKNGNNIRYVGYFTGSPKFSKDGSKLAIGCNTSYTSNDVTDICILNIEKFTSYKEIIPLDSYDSRLAIDEKIPLPEQCKQYQYIQTEVHEGIYSIDWSPSGDKLIIVCGDNNNREVCLLSLDGKSNCWENENSRDVFRALWSPVDNVILVSLDTIMPHDISLVTLNGEVINNIGIGWNAEWSPDGKEIAYVEQIEDSDHRYYQGIAIVNVYGQHHKWAYLPDKNNKSSFIYMDGINSGIPARLAWSPDGKDLLISGTNISLYNFGLFKLDIDSGELKSIIDTGVFTGIVSEPDWGP